MVAATGGQNNEKGKRHKKNMAASAFSENINHFRHVEWFPVFFRITSINRRDSANHS